MLKFNRLANKIILEAQESLLVEDVNVDDIRDMIKQMDKNSAQIDRNNFDRTLENIFYFAINYAVELQFKDIAQLLEKVVANNDFLNKFKNSLSDSEIRISKFFVPKLVDAIVDHYNKDEEDKEKLLKVMNLAIDNMQRFYTKSDYSFKLPQATKKSNYSSILKAIDAAHITNDDIKVFTPETFKEYTRKVKSAFSYAICLYNNNIISIIEFNDDGTIRAIHDNSNGYSNFKQILMNSNKVVAISNTYRDNIKQRQPYHEKTDEEIRDENRTRYKAHSIKREKEEMTKSVNDLIDSIKNDLEPYKDKLTNLDMFDDDSDIAKAFLNLKQAIQTTKSALKTYVDKEWSLNNSAVVANVKNLKTIYFRLIEMLENEDNTL